MNNKKIKTIFLKSFIIIFTVLTMVIAPFLKTKVYAASDSILSSSTQSLLEEKMKSKTFTYNNTTYHISGNNAYPSYYDNLYGNRNGERVKVEDDTFLWIFQTGSANIEFKQTDPITSLIPIEVFEELNNKNVVYSFMGEKWGVIIDSFLGNYDERLFIVQVIEIKITNTINENEFLKLRIEPVFETQYVWISNSDGKVNLPPNESFNYDLAYMTGNYKRTGPEGLYAMPSADIEYNAYLNTVDFDYYFSKSKRNYISNFAFAGILTNEQEPNYGHLDYDSLDDYGAYFVGSDINFSAYEIDDLVNPKQRIEGKPEAMEIITSLVGLIPKMPYAVDVALFMYDMIKMASEYDVITLPPEHHYRNTTNAFTQYFYSSHSMQMDNYGYLIKDCTMLLDNPNYALSIFGSETSYAEGIYRISQQRRPIGENLYEEYYWPSRLDLQIKFDIHRYNPKDNFTQSVSWRGKEILNNGLDSYKTIKPIITNGQLDFNIADSFPLYNYYKNTNYYKIQMPNGYYKISYDKSLYDIIFVGDTPLYSAELDVYYLEGSRSYPIQFIYKHDNTSQSNFKVDLAKIGTYAFNNRTDIEGINIPNSVIEIGPSAFKGCNSLKDINIPNTITNIYSNTFEDCSSLQSITLPENLVAIGTSAFKGCGSLRSVTIPSSVEYIDDSAFENCVSLVSVVVEREISDITNLGNYAFAGCSSSLQITVPQNRVAEYKNKVYWSSYKNRIIANDDNFSEIELHCLSDFYNLTPLSVNYNKIYKLNVLCGKSYQIIADSNSNVKINLYDCNMNLISSNINSLITYLGVNTYYMDMELVNESSAEIVTTTFELRWEHDGERIYYNDKHNLLTHLHRISNDTYFTKLYYINNNGAGLYKLQISGNTQNGLILPTELGIIGIYNDSDRTINQLLNKYPNSNEYAITNVGQDTMYVYLPRNGYFYIDVLMPSDNYESLDLTISSVESETINLLSSMNSTFTEDLTVDNNLEEYAKKLIIKQTSKYLITLNSSDALSNNFNIIMFKQTYNSSSNSYYTNFELIEFITNTSTQKTFEISLNDGVYFIYYYGNSTNVNIDLTLTRVLQSNNDRAYAMQADPAGSGYSVGSEVRFNNGIRNNYTITEGFTRNLFFVLEDFYTYSRLDFDWYSSNVNVATVSDYGTVYAKNVSSTQSVTIYAVYKEDPSLIYYRTFTVVDDTSEEEIVITCNMSYSYSEENGLYQIELQDNNSPYPWIQYYTWSVYVPYQETDITCSMNMWGEITASGPGFATLTGTYTMNPRVTIIINLTITE